jgi:hypothetical protein
MRIPSEILVKGKRWTIGYKWGLTDGHDLVDGLCNLSDRTIFIRRELKKEEKWPIFLHELIHAILFEAHLSEDGGISGFPEEVVCSAIADVFSTLFDIRLKRRQ